MKISKKISITISILIIIISLIILTLVHNFTVIILLLIGFYFFNYSLADFKFRVNYLISTVILGIIIYVIWK